MVGVGGSVVVTFGFGLLLVGFAVGVPVEVDVVMVGVIVGVVSVPFEVVTFGVDSVVLHKGNSVERYTEVLVPFESGMVTISGV